MTSRPTGLTKDAGWEVGVSRTLGTDPGTMWEYLLSAPACRCGSATACRDRSKMA